VNRAELNQRLGRLARDTQQRLRVTWDRHSQLMDERPAYREAVRSGLGAIGGLLRLHPVTAALLTIGIGMHIAAYETARNSPPRDTGWRHWADAEDEYRW
jgi:hypothetical protein